MELREQISLPTHARLCDVPTQNMTHARTIKSACARSLHEKKIDDDDATSL
jgi:hypothetical protein